MPPHYVFGSDSDEGEIIDPALPPTEPPDEDFPRRLRPDLARPVVPHPVPVRPLPPD